MEHVIAFDVGRGSPARRAAPSRLHLAMLAAWYERYLQRQALRGLDDRMLADIGVTRAEADSEARKPFWVA